MCKYEYIINIKAYVKFEENATFTANLYTKFQRTHTPSYTPHPHHTPTK